MKRFIMLLPFITHLFAAGAQPADFTRYPVYTGKDLGITYSPQRTIFKIWAPTASAAELKLYHNGTGDFSAGSYPMVKQRNGAWMITVYTDQKNKFYSFRVKIKDQWSDEVTDPYVKAVGVNGKRGAVVDLAETNPPGWDKDRSPVLQNPVDAIIYELHVRDASISPTSGIQHKGKFLGLTETGTKNEAGFSTGLDHIKELGVTHVHLLPSFDYNSVDESNPDARFNWGYDPLNYNVPEGSYSTNPYEGATRIREFKQLVQAFHANGVGVIMDVVYNHTALSAKSNFNQLVPGYYYRQNKEGGFSNATACGNETASERPMFRKFMLESMRYWVQEYHIDGFRLDLMGVHDIETMNLISRELHKIKPGILLYGEGWTAGASPLPDSQRAVKANAARLDRIAVFSDDIRDGIKGSVFEHADKGFASGKPGMEESIKFGITAACPHPQVDYAKVNYSKAAWAASPAQTVSYCECHDNHVLWDKLGISAKEATDEERRNMHKLAISVVLTSQGISFLHAGTEFLRSKSGVENSYDSPDSINAINWDLKTANAGVFSYIKTLVSLRKDHPALRQQTAESIAKNIRFYDSLPDGLVVYEINGKAAGDKWTRILVCFNGSGKEATFTPEGSWKFFIQDNSTVLPETAGEVNKAFRLSPYSCSVLYQL
ncbi:MAG: type I pullulanase [Sphingobacteriales bacterium]|nr:type I pullulanase [Sphingobacteriales bacterium]